VAASSTVISVPCHRSMRPAERAEAKSRNWSTGKARSARTRRMTPPTWPVAPTMPTLITSNVTDPREARPNGYPTW
jgi:hypothetical protein